MLDQELFNKLHTISSQDYDYIGYVPIGHPMLLYSVFDGSALACLHVRYQSNINNNKFPTVVTELNESNNQQQQFQVIFPKDNEDIEFIITNLSSESYINFNIMKTDTKVLEVDPGGLNQANELRPLQSCVIRSDQTVGNKSIKINVNIKKNEKNEDVKTELIKEVSENKENKVGTYLYLSVVPQSNDKQLCEKFIETIWKPSDFFIIKKKSNNYKSNDFFNAREHTEMSRVGVYTEMSRGGNSRGNNMSRGGNTRGYTFEELGGNTRGSSNFSHFDSEELEEQSTRLVNQSDKIFPRSRVMDRGENLVNLTDKILDRGEKLVNLIDKTLDRGEKLHITKTINNSHPFETSHEEIYKSQVANLSYGEQVSVTTVDTGLNYAYDLHSKRCILGLSVFENLKIAEKPNQQYMKQQIIDYVDKIINNKLAELLKELTMVYTSESCCICMDNKPDTVFYKCGHKCVHEECSKTLDKCPMCRGFIYHKIKT